MYNRQRQMRWLFWFNIGLYIFLRVLLPLWRLGRLLVCHPSKVKYLSQMVRIGAQDVR